VLIPYILITLTASGSANVMVEVRKCDYFFKEISQNLQYGCVQPSNRANRPEVMAIRTDTAAGVAILRGRAFGEEGDGGRDGTRASAVAASSG